MSWILHAEPAGRSAKGEVDIRALALFFLKLFPSSTSRQEQLGSKMGACGSKEAIMAQASNLATQAKGLASTGFAEVRLRAPPGSAMERGSAGRSSAPQRPPRRAR